MRQEDTPFWARTSGCKAWKEAPLLLVPRYTSTLKVPSLKCFSISPFERGQEGRGGSGQ